MINSGSLRVLIVSLLVSVVHMTSISGEGPSQNDASINEMKLRFAELKSQNLELQLNFQDLKKINQKLLEERENCTELFDQNDYIIESLKPIQDEVNLLQTFVEQKYQNSDSEKKLMMKLSNDNESVNLTAVATDVNRMSQSIQTLLQKFQTLDDDMNRNLNNTESTVVESINAKRPPKSLNTLFKKIGKKYYYIEKEEKLNWFAAAQKCQGLGGYLVNIESLLEINLLKKHITTGRYWTAANKLADKANYYSIATGKQIPYTFWYLGEPNNYEKNEHCVEIRPDYSYNMNDFSCDANFNFICEAKV